MTTPVSNLTTLLRSMEPVLHDGVYAYCTVSHEAQIAAVASVVTVREPEGLTLVVSEEQAVAAGLPVLFRAAWITLTVHSDLDAVGLTAAFSSALGQAGISCNVVAGAFHDHIFVPVAQAQKTLQVLRALQQDALHGSLRE
jgi:hypothetical protein